MEWLLRLLHPCLHEWETVATLKDREENPTAATVVQTCKLCGKNREATFRAPKGHGCPPHKWKLTDTTVVWGQNRDGSKRGDHPIAKIIQLTCEHCGEMRHKKVNSEGDAHGHDG